MAFPVGEHSLTRRPSHVPALRGNGVGVGARREIALVGVGVVIVFTTHCFPICTPFSKCGSQLPAVQLASVWHVAPIAKLPIGIGKGVDDGLVVGVDAGVIVIFGVGIGFIPQQPNSPAQALP